MCSVFYIIGMDKITPFIIFRKDGFYNDLIEYIKMINIPEKTDILVFVNKSIIIDKNDFNIEQIEIDINNTLDIRKNIYNRLE